MLKFLLLMFVSVSVFATDIQLTWDLPELRNDGSKIETIDKFNLYQTTNNGSQVLIEVQADTTSLTLSDVSQGSHTFQISTVEAGLEGNLSDPITVNVTTSKPVKIVLTVEIIN